VGSDTQFAKEAPVHLVGVDGFWIDVAPVTNRQFRKFVNAAGWSANHPSDAAKACCIPDNPRGGRDTRALIRASPKLRVPARLNYCRRCRSAARHAQQTGSSMSHVGFRCVVRDARS
jgi:formylglycine-generating enzyme required for sulfatase activity